MLFEAEAEVEVGLEVLDLGESCLSWIESVLNDRFSGRDEMDVSLVGRGPGGDFEAPSACCSMYFAWIRKMC